MCPVFSAFYLEIPSSVAKTVPDILKEASKSPLGIFALMVLLLGGLAYVFFRRANPRIKIIIFMVLFAGAVAYGVAVVNVPRSVDSPAPENSLVLAGTIVDSSSDAAVPQAEVSLVGRSEMTLSDDHGNFKITLQRLGVSAPELRLRVSKDGFKALDYQVTPPADGLVLALHRK